MLKPFFKRLLIVATPLMVLYIFAQLAFEQNRKQVHRTDAGLGIAILAIFLLGILVLGFMTDLGINIFKKQYKIVKIDILFLILLVIPFLYLFCQFFCSY